ncbi:MAG: 3-deoxy-manno-octulosonate cytidylyltransferase, partial [Candidatus Cloacimonadota bacterium]|nr:3-deoxy-manno-octulosonate cytidylyltransferase [Candidatus Cloacimonadota bacterium]
MIIAVIPARYGSTRLPGKPLKLLAGKPIIQHVYQKVQTASLFHKVIVATDDKRIRETVLSFGGNVQMTSSNHRSGSDRIAEVIRDIPAEIVVNVQGDEPFITASALQTLLNQFQDQNIKVASLMHPIKEDINNPNRVKVVCDKQNFALYFSRASIPYNQGNSNKLEVFQHIGVYAYRKKALLEFVQSEPTILEKAEKLEQLHFLENG